MSGIDFIITWVDNNDKKWIEDKNYYQKLICKDISDQMNSEARYRDWENLIYWFRSVEENAPWVNKIFFITEGHIPEWLNVNHKKLVIVKHSDYIDDKFLPTFNSNVIELNFSKIEELSEQFVSFNDDMFLNDFVREADFFKNDLPCDSGVFSPIVPIEGTIDSIVLKNIEVINKYFDKNNILKNNLTKYFNLKYRKHIIKNICTLPWSNVLGFYDNHIPISYFKKTFSEVWNKEESKLLKGCENKFRTTDELSHWLMRYWQLSTGQFSPRSTNFGKYYNISDNPKDIVEDIKYSKNKVICINDNNLFDDYEFAKKQINDAFKTRYPNKSSYER